MNQQLLRIRDFWELAHSAATEPHGHVPTIMADLADEHGSPIRAHLLRHGVPEHQVAPRGPGVAYTGSARTPNINAPVWVFDAPNNIPGVIFKDEGVHVRRLFGRGWEQPPEALAGHVDGPESFQLFHAGSEGFNTRFAVRYTLRLRDGRHLRLTAPVEAHHIRAIADATHHPAWEEWAGIAEHAGHQDTPQPIERPQEKQVAVHLARLMLSPGKPYGRAFGSGDAIREHRILDESGKDLGFVRVQPLYDGRNLHIHLIGRSDDAPASDANTLGGEAMRSLVDALAKHYKKAQVIQGHRGTSVGSGYRGVVAGKPPLVVFPIRRKLARQVYRAPSPGGISGGGLPEGGIFQKPGFMAKTRRRIRDVASKLEPDKRTYRQQIIDSLPKSTRRAVPNARPDAGRYVALVKGIAAEPKDANARLVFADHLQDNGVLGAHVIRRHVEQAGEHIDNPRKRLTTVLPFGHGQGRKNSPIVAVHPDGRLAVFGPDGEGTVPDWEKAQGDAALAQLATHGDNARGRSGVAVMTLHHTRDPENPPPPKPEPPDPNLMPYDEWMEAHVTYEHELEQWEKEHAPKRLIHVAHAKTADDLRHLLSDFTPEAREALLRQWIDDGTLRKRLSGKGSGKYQLARGDQKTNIRALLGERAPGEAYDQPLTLGQLKAIEDSHALPKSHRLSPHATQTGNIGDEHPYTVPIEHAIRFLGHLSRSAIGPGKLKKVLADPKATDAAKQDHLIAHLHADYDDSPKGDWYSGAIDALDRAFSRHYGVGKLDDEGKLVGKGAPHEHHPELVLFKTLIGITSPMANPVDNTRFALRIWNDALRRARANGSDDPIAHIADRDTHSLDTWVQKLKDLHGVESIPDPGTDWKARAKWYAKWVHGNEAELGVPAYSAAEARVFFHNEKKEKHPHHGVLVHRRGRNNQILDANPAAPKESRTGAKAKYVPLPLVNEDGSLRARGFGGSTDIVPSLHLLKKVVDKFRTPDGGTKSAYREAAKWLFEFHTREDVERVFGKDFRKKMFGKGLFDEGESAPGFMVFGPKVGVFMTNLHANDPATRESHGGLFTHDTWMQRMLLTHLGRLTGDAESKQVSSPDRAEFRKAAKALAAKLGITAAELQADLWYYAQGTMRRLGVSADRIGSYSFRDAADKLLPTKLARLDTHAGLLAALGGKTWKRHSKRVAVQKNKDASISVFIHGKRTLTAHPDGTVKRHPVRVKLARPINFVRPGETPHQAMTRHLAGRTTRVVGRTARLEQEGDDVGLYLHGYRIVTAHPNGQVTLDHHGYMTPTTRRFMEGFSGHGISFAGGKFLVNGQEHPNGDKYPPDQMTPVPQRVTIPHTDPELRNWWKQVRPHHTKPIDHTTAQVLGDWLEEHNDWRHHLLRKTVDSGLPLDNRRMLTNHPVYLTPPPVPSSPSYRPIGESYHHVSASRNPQDRSLYVDTYHPTASGPNTYVHSRLTPEEYAAMRAEAATAGVHFPEAPK